MSVSIHSQIKCVAREIALRKAVYPGAVKRARMTEAEAEREIETMIAVLETLKAVAQPELKLDPALTAGA